LLALGKGTRARLRRRRSRFAVGQRITPDTRARSIDAEYTYGLEEAFESQHAQRSGLHKVLRRGVYARADKDLAFAGFVAQACSEIHDASDCPIIGSTLDADCAQGGIAEIDARSETQLMTTFSASRH